MKKIINSPEDVVEEMIEGLTKSYPELVHRVGDSRVVARNYEGKGKVGIVSGGGSGHEPSHAGFVGRGMLAAAVCGDVFTSPTPDQILMAIHEVDKGAGVFLDIKNYTGDVMNFEMARDMARDEGIKVEEVVVDDDIAVENSLYTAGRRGVAGTVLVHKVLGAAAEAGYTLEQIKSLAEKIIPDIKTIGVALSAATTPESGKPGFVLKPDEMEYGVGIHSEPGYRREKLKPSKDIAKELYGKISAEFKLVKGDKVVVLVNGMGATPLMEQYVFANDVNDLLKADRVEIVKSMVGNYMTSIDMAGISLTLFKIEDPKWLEFINAPADTIAWKSF